MKLEDYFEYDPISGIVYRKAIQRNCLAAIGDPVGHRSSYGYLEVRFDKKIYKVHRLAWFLHYGEWPQNSIDHINRDKLDNRIKNLRDVSSKENTINTGRYNEGASFMKHNQKWQSRVYNKEDGGYKYLGCYGTEEEAKIAYREYHL